MNESNFMNDGAANGNLMTIGRDVVICTKRLHDKAILPSRGSASAAGYDLHTMQLSLPTVLDPGETRQIRLGFAIQIPEGYFGAIFARSGLATKNGLRPANCVGIIDSDYRGEVIVPLRNESTESQRINPGDRIAQLVIIPYLPVTFFEVEDLQETDRGEDGFGSTGK